MTLIKEVLPPPPVQKVEKAGIDEVFLDLSAQIHFILLERYPELATAPYDDPTEYLPSPPSSALNWEADHLVDLDDNETEDDDPDWDDIVMNIGSEIVRGVRSAIRERLKYTCSGGIARNKMMAKLGSGANKPNKQTIVRNRAVQHFLSGYKFTKIRNLGGKLGEQVVETFNTDDVTELLKIPLDQLKSKLGDDTGTWLHGIIRGDDTSEVTSRTQIKSMLSAKSFRPTIHNFEQAVKWLQIFVADIYGRLVEEGVLENKRRPKTMNLHHRQGGQTRSRQIPIPQGKKIDRDMLLELAKTLLGQIILEGRVWPCSNLSLSVGGFEEGPSGNREIGSFFLKGDEAPAHSEASSRENSGIPDQLEERSAKRLKSTDNSSLDRFFAPDEGTDDHEEEQEATVDQDTSRPLVRVRTETHAHHLHQADIGSFFCQKCSKSIPESDRDEHNDWHFAKDLQAQDKPLAPLQSRGRPPDRPDKPKVKGGGHGTRGRSGRAEKGQSRLAFG